MTLTVEAHRSLDAIGRTAWLDLESRAPGATVFQSWWWLSAWWPVWGAGEPVVLAVREGGTLVGLGAFYLARGGTLRLMGEEHADYGGVLAAGDRADVVDALVAALLERTARWQRLCLNDLPVTGLLSTRLLALGAHRHGAVPCPRVRFAVRSLDSLLDKDSLKRHERRLAEHGALGFRHLDAAAEIEPWLPRFVAQHIERWALTATPSLFLEPRNVEFYSALIGSAEPGGPLLFTVVESGGRPVAMHVGLRSQDELIWYKPTFDPRLAQAGPGEVLLAELLRRAGREGAAGLDFTRGAEAFKLRFASELRHVATVEAWPRPGAAERARRGRAIKASLKGLLVRLGVKDRLVAAAGAGARLVGHARREGPAGIVRRLSRRLESPRASTLELYGIPRGTGAEPAGGRHGTLSSVVRLASLDDLFEHVDPAAAEHAELLRHARARFASGDALYAGLVDDELVAHGWETRRAPLPVTELGAQLVFPEGTRVLYDFRVAEAARGRGHYVSLLGAIAQEAGSERTLIYTRSDHGASRRGIEAAGFQRLGRLAEEGGVPAIRLAESATAAQRRLAEGLALVAAAAAAGEGGGSR